MNRAWERIAAFTREEIGPDAEGWIEAVPRALPELAERWSLRLGEPFEAETTSYVLPAERTDGSPAVLKLIYPHYPETPFAQEVAGLGMWNGRGVVRLLEAEAEIGAQLLERAMPGTSALELDEDDALAIAAEVLLRMWTAQASPHPEIRTLAEQARIWATEIVADWEAAGEPYERDLLERGRSTLLRLADDVGRRAAEELVLVHGDLHHGNVLRAEREPWLAIDPKPILGEREYDLRAPLCDRREALFADRDPAARLRRRLDGLLGTLGDVDAQRPLEWAFVVELTWCTNGLTEAGPDGNSARMQLRSAELLASLID
ncbi:MAG: aminoglycoside phosphotransferase family protein [Actinomycetota bacterium]|jgi:streptomycin 6-kinase